MRDLECSFLPSETVVMAEELPSCALQLSVHSQSSQGGEDEAEWTSEYDLNPYPNFSI